MADRMSTRRKTLLARFAHAKMEADASNARVRQRSANLLDNMLNDPDLKRQVKGLNDPGLTPLDRVQLQQALVLMAPSARRRFSLRARERLQVISRHTIYHWRAMVRFAVFAALLLAEILTSSVHTPVGRPVRLARALIISWDLLDGSFRPEQEEKDTRLILMRRPNGSLALRRWFDGVGYGELPVEPSFVRQETYLSD
jgi:hypothetical protein